MHVDEKNLMSIAKCQNLNSASSILFLFTARKFSVNISFFLSCSVSEKNNNFLFSLMSI